ncbi:MAG: hypothetical protein IKX00_02605 [Bacilli bacterium]|nr:hypothetical protein [Bacilli bacterium]
MRQVNNHDSCDHFFIKCFDDYDWYEGTHCFCYGCIKCKLCTGGPFYESYMANYFTFESSLKYWWSKLEFSYSSYEISFGRAIHLYEQISAEKPNISNKELYEILKVKSEEYMKLDTEPKKDEISRKRS